MQQQQEKELLLSGGAGAISFQAGYIQGLLEIISKDKLKEYKIGGVSSGCCIAAYLIYSLYSDFDMKYWYEKYIRNVFQQVNKSLFGFWETGKIIKEGSKEFFRDLVNYGINLEGKLHLYISVKTGLFKYEKMLIDKFDSDEQFAEAVHCSCTIPAITGLQLAGQYQGLKAIDGGLTMGIPFKNINSKCIFLNILPKIFTVYPIIAEKPNDLKIINIAEEFSFSFPGDYWLWDEYNADKQFLQGYLAAKNQEQQLKEIFQ